jgi:hypothetical protein
MRWLSLCLLTSVLLFNLVTLAQEQSSLTTDTASSQFATDKEKIAFLERYLELPTQVEAAEYTIVYQDNSSGRVPGPSDWDMRVVVKVAPEDISSWPKSLTETTQAFDLEWAYHFANAEGWQLTSAPQFFVASSKRVAVFEVEGVVVVWLSTF